MRDQEKGFRYLILFFPVLLLYTWVESSNWLVGLQQILKLDGVAAALEWTKTEPTD